MVVEANQERGRERIASAIGVAAFHLLLGYVLISGFRMEAGSRFGDTLKLFDVARETPSPPPPEPPLPAARTEEAEGAAAPAGLEADVSPVVIPPPEVRLRVPPPIVAAPTPGVGSQTSQGASDTPEPGTGAGGEGAGTGSGGSGVGAAGGGAAVKPQQVAGELSGRDYPRAAKRARAGGTVLVRYTVGTDGRVSGCTVTQSSGNVDLDSVTCTLVERRFRYEPARDAQGRPVTDTLTGRHIWWTEPKRQPYPFVWEPPAGGDPQ